MNSWVKKGFRAFSIRTSTVNCGLAGLALWGAAAELGAADPRLDSIPFSERSAPSGDTLFTELAPERTGIVTVNDYDDPRMWRELHREYHIGAIGTGVAIGDYDGDGLADVFVVSKVESGRLFRNLGDWRFEDVTEAAGVEDASGAWKQGAAFVDVDNDGDLDLYVCRFAAANQLFMNQGDGTFRDEARERGLAVADASGMGCFADYDRDGWLDVYLQTNILDASASPDGQADYLFRNNGDGTFRDVTKEAGILDTPTQGHSATWWDQDGDGWLDLYVANDFDPPDFLYRNNGDGTFTDVIDQVLPHTPFSSMGSDIGDVDGDGRMDLYVVDMAGTTYERTQRGTAEYRGRALSEQNERVGVALQLLYNALYLNTGTDRCLEVAYLAGVEATDWSWAVRFEDLDNDGRIDLFVTNGTDREQNNVDMVSRRLAALSPYARIGITKSSPILAQANLAYANRGGLRFEEVGRDWGLNQIGASFGAAFGDLDGDGDLDVVYTNYQKGATALRNDSQSGNRLIVALRGQASNRFGLGARVEVTTPSGTQARQLLSARGYLSTSEPAAHFGLGEDERVETLKVVWPSGRIQVVRDLLANRRYTLMEPKEPSPQPPVEAAGSLFVEASRSLGLAVLQREEVLEGTVGQPLLPRRFNRRGPGLAVGDLDGDGADEVVVGATARDGAKILSRSERGYRRWDLGSLGEAPPINDGPPLIFDANGDGANDLLLTAGGAALPAEEPEYEPRLWYNDGNGGFSRAPSGTLPPVAISVGAAVAADFDRDGSLDVFLGGRLFPGFYPEPAYSALLLRRGSVFRDETDTFAPGLGEVGLVTSALASDVDGDRWIDLLVALEWGGVRLFRNQGGAGFVEASRDWGFDAAGVGLWTSIAAADFNEDGRLDYALGNQGLNTIYAASRDRPMRLYSHDFAGSGEPQLVLAYGDHESLSPVASRSELAAKIPGVLKRFPSNNDYAAANLEQILGPEALAAATVYEAGELRSGVLLSQSDGRYSFSALPRLAQISPAQGMVASDVDGDGHADLLLVNNDYSPIPALGRFDSGFGWLLAGDGSGALRPVPVVESGWQAPGNAKALVLADVDGDARPDAIASRNDEATLAFRNETKPGGLAFAARLRGRGGNPDGIGSRMELVVEGQVLRVWEIHAGGGFASQSTASVFFSLSRGIAPAAKLRVLWASGLETESPLPEGGGSFLVEEQ